VDNPGVQAVTKPDRKLCALLALQVDRPTSSYRVDEGADRELMLMRIKAAVSRLWLDPNKITVPVLE